MNADIKYVADYLGITYTTTAEYYPKDICSVSHKGGYTLVIYLTPGGTHHIKAYPTLLSRFIYHMEYHSW